MKILFVHEVSYRNKVVFEMHEIPERLVNLGLDEVIFLDYEEDPENSWRPHLKRLDRFIEGRSDINTSVRLITIRRLLPGIVDRLVLALRALWIAPRILATVRPDVVVTYAVPTLGWQFQRACSNRGIPLVYRAIDVSHQIRKSPFQRMVKWAERRLLRDSDLVIFNNPALAQYAKDLGTTMTRSEIVAPGFDPWPDIDSRDYSVRDFDYNVVFMGTLFDFCGLDWFLRQLASEPDRYGAIRLLIVGDGEMRPFLAEFIEERNMSDRVQMTGRVDYGHLNSLLSRALVSIIPFNLLPVTSFALPGKVPQYIRSGLATVSTNLQGLKSLLPEGYGVTYSEPGTEFLDEVIHLLGDEERRQLLVEDGRQVLDTNLRWSTQLRTFRYLLENLV